MIDNSGKYVIPPNYSFLTEKVKGYIWGGGDPSGLSEGFYRNVSFSYNPAAGLTLETFCNESEDCYFLTNPNYEFPEDDFYVIKKYDSFTIKHTPDRDFNMISGNSELLFWKIINAYWRNGEWLSSERPGISDYRNGFFRVIWPNRDSYSGYGEFVDYINPYDDLNKGLIGEDYYEESGSGDFYDGFAKVLKQGKYGFINEKGEEIVPLRFEHLGLFKNGFAIAHLNGNKGYINQNGEFLFPPNNNFQLYDFNEDLAVVGEDLSGTKDIMYVINKKGDKVFSFPDFMYLEGFSKFSNGKIIYPNKDGNNYVYDNFGNILFKLNFPLVFGFSSDGYAVVGESRYEGPYNIISAADGMKFSNSNYDNIYLICTDTFGTIINTFDFKKLKSDLFSDNQLNGRFDITKTNFFWNGLIFVERSGFKFYVDKDGFEYVE